jgi:hypothetical protein
MLFLLDNYLPSLYFRAIGLNKTATQHPQYTFAVGAYFLSMSPLKTTAFSQVQGSGISFLNHYLPFSFSIYLH